MAKKVALYVGIIASSLNRDIINEFLEKCILYKKNIYAFDNLSNYSDKVNIVNYDSIQEIGATKISIKSYKDITVEGKNLKLSKLLNNEILVTGDIEKIYFNE